MMVLKTKPPFLNGLRFLNFKEHISDGVEIKTSTWIFLDFGILKYSIMMALKVNSPGLNGVRFWNSKEHTYDGGEIKSLHLKVFRFWNSRQQSSWSIDANFCALTFLEFGIPINKTLSIL